MRRENNENNKIGYLFMSAFCLIYIALYCWLGFYAWPQTADWSFAELARKNGLLQFINFHYNSINGRIMQFIFLWFLLHLPYMDLYGLYPLITVLMYASAVYFFVHVIYNASSTRLKFLLTLIITCVTFSVMTALCETIYWLSAMHYIWSMTLLILSFALAFRALNGSKSSFFLCMLTLFLDGITLEQPVIFQGIIAFIAALYFLWAGNRKKAAICGIFWAVSIAAFMIMALAPGTSARWHSQNTFLAGSTFVLLFRILYITVIHGIITLCKFFMKPVIYVFLLFVPCIAERINFIDNKISERLKAWHITLCVIIISMSMQAIGAITMGDQLPPRAESFALWTMASVWFFMWGFCYRNKKILSRIQNLKIFKIRWIILIIFLVLNSNFIYLIDDLRTAPIYRAEHEQRVQMVIQQKANGIKKPVVPFLSERPKLLFYAENAEGVGVNDFINVPKAVYGNPEAVKRWLNGDINDINLETETDSVLIRIIGNMYDTHNTTSKLLRDNKKAMQLYYRAVELGDIHAKRSIARLYLTDKSLKNYFKGIYWLLLYALS